MRRGGRRARCKPRCWGWPGWRGGVWERRTVCVPRPARGREIAETKVLPNTEVTSSHPSFTIAGHKAHGGPSRLAEVWACAEGFFVCFVLASLFACLKSPSHSGDHWSVCSHAPWSRCQIALVCVASSKPLFLLRPSSLECAVTLLFASTCPIAPVAQQSPVHMTV